jgi:hypothetical protein
MTEEFHRIRRLPPYVFAEVNQAKAKARAAAEDIIDLGMGNPDSPTPPHIVAKLIETVADPRSHRYSTSKGIPGLRRALAGGDRDFGFKRGAGEPVRCHYQPGRYHFGAEPVLPDPSVWLHHRGRFGALDPGGTG